MRRCKILFLTKYPDSDDLKDGYFQRVLSIDNFLEECSRIYVDYNSNIFLSVKKIEKNIIEIKTSKYNPVGLVFIFFMAIRSDALYLHSILRLKSFFHKIIFLSCEKRIIDLHGVVPEEFKMAGDTLNYQKFNKIELFALSRATVLVSVTRKMIDYLGKKHSVNIVEKSFILPILPKDIKFKKEIGLKDIKSVIYCGGLQKWQQVDKMLDFVNKNSNFLNFTFLVPDPGKLLRIYNEKYNKEFPGLITSSPSDKVIDWYANNSFGLIFRENNVVNNVACPTKLVEYFQNDVLPIVDSENIGDFKDLGFEYVKIGDKIPDSAIWKSKILKNRTVYLNIREKFNAESERLRDFLNN